MLWMSFAAVTVDTPPSRFKVCRRISDYDASQSLDQDSLKILVRMFPRLDRETDLDWSGGDPAFRCVVLQGDQCLVFFLGGLPVPGERKIAGFSKDPHNPAATADREAPLFPFAPERLVRRHGNAFYSYLDTYELQPYAYFSAYSQDHGYNRYFTDYRDSDCAGLGVWPYASKIYRPKYHNPQTIQILSAGADGRFGAGTIFPEGQGRPWSADASSALEPEARDDLSNFHPGPLGQNADPQR